MNIKTEQGHIFELITFANGGHSIISKMEDDDFGKECFYYTDEFSPEEIKVVYDALVASGWFK
jgi:hypothetical protein